MNPMTTSDWPAWAPTGVWLIVTAWVCFFLLTLLVGSKRTILLAFFGFLAGVIMYGKPPPTEPAST